MNINQPNQSLTLFSLLMVIFLDVMGILLVLPVLTPLLLQTNAILPPSTPLIWRDFFYGVSLGIFPLFMFFSTPILGDLSDRYGRKKILLICLIISALSYILSTVAIIYHNLSLLLASRMIAGLAAGTQPIATAAIIDKSTPNTKTRYLSWVVFISTIGVVIGPLIGGLTAEKKLSTWFNYQTPFVVAAILGLLNALFLYCTLKETKTTPKTQTIQLTKGFTLFFSAFTQSRFRSLAFSSMGYFLAWSFYFQAIGWFMMKTFHYTEGKIGLVMGCIGLIGALSLTIVMRLIMKIFTNETHVYLFLLFVMAISNIGCAITQSELSQWLWMIPNAASDAICYTLLLTLFSNSADSQSQGWIMGVVGALGAFTWSIGGILVGPLGYLYIRLPFISAGILCLISFFLIFFERKRFSK